MPALSVAAQRPWSPMDITKTGLVTKPAEPKSSLKRKRPSMDIDSEGLPVTVPSPKRTVTFNPQVEYSAESSKAPEEIKREVRLALENHKLGDDEDYHALADVFSGGKKQAPTSPATLHLYTAALAANLSAFGDKSFSHLVMTVLQCNWLKQEDQYISLYVRFLGGLVSSYGTWLSPTLKMLVQKLCDVAPAPKSSPNNDQYRAAVHVHGALRYLLQLIPSASHVLSNVLAFEFPQQLDSKKRHVRYVLNLLKLREYAPELGVEIMALIVERLVKVDVQVQVDFEDLAEEAGDDLLQNLGDLEVMEDSMSDDSDADSDDDSLDESSQKLKDVKENMGKLDAVMDVLFSEYARAFDNPSSEASATAASLLTAQFTSIILPTYRSRHTQFLLFHFMQTSPTMVDQFLGTCIHLILDRNRPAIIRQSAAAYLASFVARGLHVSRQVTRDVFSFVGDQLTQLRQMYEPDCQGPDPRRYHTYYALVQALLYIFCFRWRDLAKNPKDDDESTHSLSPPPLPGASVAIQDPDEDTPLEFPSYVKHALASNVFSRLNPLRVVAPMIATEFANTARRLSLLYAHHVIEKNKRVRLIQSTPRAGYGEVMRETALSARKDEDWMCLDGYFPFDPYRLPVSKRWVESDYRNWQGWNDDDDEEEEEEDDESSDEEGEKDEPEVASPGDLLSD